MKPELSDLLSHPIVAAAAGSLVGLKALPGASVTERLCNVAAGFAFAAFAGPAVVDHIGVISPNVKSGIIFIIGAAGLVIFNAVIEGIKKTDVGLHIGSAFDRLLSWLPKKGGE
jgi:hypothetical protein